MVLPVGLLPAGELQDLARALQGRRPGTFQLRNVGNDMMLFQACQKTRRLGLYL